MFQTTNQRYVRTRCLVMVLFQACILTMNINLAELSSPIVGMEKTEQDQFWQFIISQIATFHKFIKVRNWIPKIRIIIHGELSEVAMICVITDWQFNHINPLRIHLYIPHMYCICLEQPLVSQVYTYTHTVGKAIVNGPKNHQKWML